jgi:hypothetical protein
MSITEFLIYYENYLFIISSNLLNILIPIALSKLYLKFSQLNLKNIGTYFCIMTSKVITSDNEHALKSHVDKIAGFKEPQKLTRDQFIHIPMWFDTNESSPTLNSKIFLIRSV